MSEPKEPYNTISATQPAVLVDRAGVSAASLSVARMIDRLCKAPGTYAIELERSSYSSDPLVVSISKVETIHVVKVDT